MGRKGNKQLRKSWEKKDKKQKKQKQEDDD